MLGVMELPMIYRNQKPEKGGEQIIYAIELTNPNIHHAFQFSPLHDHHDRALRVVK